MIAKTLKGDWGWWKESPESSVKLGGGKEMFCGYTIRHKIRLFIGIRGQMQSGDYLYEPITKILKKLGLETNRLVCNIESSIISPVLNKIL